MAYIDTSVLVAYYCPEPMSDAAAKRLAKVEKPVISPLVEVEVYSAVAAKVRAEELQARAGRRILALFQEHLTEGFYDLVFIDAAQYAQARDWIAKFSTALRAPDALHLAAALSNNLALLTADQGLARAAKQMGVRHELIA